MGRRRKIPKPLRLLTMLKHMMFRYSVTFDFTENERYRIRLHDKKDGEVDTFEDDRFAIVMKSAYEKLREEI